MFIFKKNKVAQGYSVVPVISSLSRIIKLNELLNKTTCTGIYSKRFLFVTTFSENITNKYFNSHFEQEKKNLTKLDFYQISMKFN